MKKTVLNLMKLTFVGSLVMLYSCGGGASENTEEATSEEAVTTEEPAAVNEDAVQEEAETTATLDITKGKEIYDAKCKVCHQENGEGTPGAFPPLAKSDYLANNLSEAVAGVIAGQNGELTVNGTVYNTPMPPNVLTDEEATDVMNYVLNSWGNEHEAITVVDGKLAE